MHGKAFGAVEGQKCETKQSDADAAKDLTPAHLILCLTSVGTAAAQQNFRKRSIKRSRTAQFQAAQTLRHWTPSNSEEVNA